MERKIKDTPPRLPVVFQNYDSPLYLITFNTLLRRPLLACDEVHRAFRDYAERGFSFHIAVGRYVLMPDHIHVLLTPAPEIALERAVQFIKGGFSYRLRKMENFQVWQESFTNHRIRDADDYQRHCEYVRMNPVRAKLVREAMEYSYSSANPAFGEIDAPAGAKARAQTIQLTRP